MLTYPRLVVLLALLSFGGALTAATFSHPALLLLPVMGGGSVGLYVCFPHLFTRLKPLALRAPPDEAFTAADEEAAIEPAPIERATVEPAAIEQAAIEQATVEPAAIEQAAGSENFDSGAFRSIGGVRRISDAAPVIGLCLVPILFYAYVQLRLPRPAENDICRFARQNVCFIGCVEQVLSQRSKERRLLIVRAKELMLPKACSVDGRVLVTIKERKGVPGDIAAGSTLEILTRLRSVETVTPAGYSASLKRSDVFSTAFAGERSATVLLPSDGAPQAVSSWSMIEACRAKLISTHNEILGKPLGMLLSSMVLGESSVGLDAGIVSTFRDVGLSHLLAASGFNLTIVTATSYFCARALLPSALFANVVSFSAMIWFVLLAGPTPSVVRASLVLTLVLIGHVMFRSLNMLACLSFALLITLFVDPLSVASVGFQLSYAATAGILIASNCLSERLARFRRRKWARYVIESAICCLTAQASVLPLQLFYFARTGLLFLPANMAVVPMVAPVTTLGFASSSLALLPFADNVLRQGCDRIVWALDRLAFYPLSWMVSIAEYLASFDKAQLDCCPPSIPAILAYYTVFCLFLHSIRLKKYELGCGAALTVLTVLLFLNPHANCPETMP
ncbi:MAG TPA: ComEC/Rec2 family competence protein [Candidatus Obscuribacterales bacterium]